MLRDPNCHRAARWLPEGLPRLGRQHPPSSLHREAPPGVSSAGGRLSLPGKGASLSSSLLRSRGSPQGCHLGPRLIDHRFPPFLLRALPASSLREPRPPPLAPPSRSNASLPPPPSVRPLHASARPAGPAGNRGEPDSHLPLPSAGRGRCCARRSLAQACDALR